MAQETKSHRELNKIVIICAAIILITTIVTYAGLEITTPNLKIDNVQINYVGDSPGRRNYNAIITVNNFGLTNAASVVQFSWTKGNLTSGYYGYERESVYIINNAPQVVTIHFQVNQNVTGPVVGATFIFVNGQIVDKQDKFF